MPKDVVADVAPLDVSGTRTVAVGTAGWLVALLVLLAFGGRLRDDGNADWLWTCVAGVGLGIFGLWYCRRRARAGGEPPPPGLGDADRDGSADGSADAGAGDLSG